MKPPMIPHQGRAIDTVNFRTVKESADGEGSGGLLVAGSFGGLAVQGQSTAVARLKGVGLDSGLATPGGEEGERDPFEEFNSVTLLHDGDEDRR